MTPKVTWPGRSKWPDLKLRFSKFDIVPKTHQWSELFETHNVQSLLKVAIHGGGGATRPDLGRAVQFEGHWIARPNPGRQRAGGAAGAGAEWGSNRSAESGNRGAGKLW